MSVIKDDMSKLMEHSDDEPNVVVQIVKETVDDLIFCHVTELEESLRYVIPVLLRTLQQIYTKNNVIVQSNKGGGVLDLITTNFKIALNLMDISNDILECVMKSGTVALSIVPSVPVNVAHMLFITFEHCKNGQKIYSCYYKTVTEILDLFRKTQEVHTKFLIFLDSYLTIDFSNESEFNAYKEILDIILKISITLSGINMKSMADNWKSFIALVQKSSAQNVMFYNLSPAIRILTEEINSNLLGIYETESSELKKLSQSFKVTGFLVKVVLKLLETNLNSADNFEDVLKFWIMIYSWHSGFFQTNRFTDEIVDAVNALFTLCSESVPDLIIRDCEFLNQFCLMHEDFAPSNQSFGFLMFTNALIKELPKLRNDPEMVTNFSVVPLLRLAFNLTRKCYMDFFCDYNSNFYEEFVINVSVVVLLFPRHFSEIEDILLECVLDNSMWTALVAIDVWSLILRYASQDVCRSILTTLIKVTEDLQPGIFQQTPVIVFLKILTQRILKALSDSTRNEEITKYNPTSHLLVWKVLNLSNIPLSHRYYIEFLLCDVIDKMDFSEEADCSVSNILTLMENLDTISYTNFRKLEINPTRMIPLIIRLWSFNIRDISPSNNFLKYFIYKLIKVTIAITGELSGDDLILVLTQLKILLGEVLFKLLTCALLESISRRNFSSFHEKDTLFALIINLFQMLLSDKNAVVVQTCLESFLKISNSNNYENIIPKISSCCTDVKTIVADYTQRKAGNAKYTVKYFDKIRIYTYHHKCWEWTNAYQPVRKKFKVDSDINIVLNNLNNETEKLLNRVNAVQLDERQKMHVKDVIKKLEKLLK